MADITINYGLTKPLQNESYNVDVQNGNMDIIDTQLLANLLTAKGYTDTKIQALLNSAPSALDTLKELADALGDDANFAATITNLINTKFSDLAGAGRTTQTVKSNADAIVSINTSLSDVAKNMAQLSNPNLLINGDTQIWQKGTSFLNIQGYTADRWYYICYDNVPLGSVSKDTDGSIKMTNFNTVQNHIQQIMETNISEKLAGKKVTLSADIKVSNMTKGSLFLQLLSSLSIDSINYTGYTTDKLAISLSDVSSEYKRFSFTFTVPSNTKTLVPQIGSNSSIGNGIVNSNCIVNIRNIKLEIGDKATPFTPRLYSNEERDCKRYGEPIIRNYRATGFTNSNGYFVIDYPFFVEKRVPPTVNKPTDYTNIIEVIGQSNATPTLLEIYSTKQGVRILGVVANFPNQSVEINFTTYADSEIY